MMSTDVLLQQLERRRGKPGVAPDIKCLRHMVRSIVLSIKLLNIDNMPRPFFHLLTLFLLSSALAEEPHVFTIDVHKGSVMGLAFSPDGKTLASSSRDKTIKLWDVQTRTLKQTLQGHTAEVCCVAFSPDGKLLASCSGDKTVRTWEVWSAQPLRTFRGH